MTCKKYLLLCCVLLALAAPAAFAQSTLWWSGGTTNITDGTPLVTNWANMNGTWGTAIKNFATDTNGTTYSAWVNGSAMRVFSSGYLNDNTAQDITNTMVTDMTMAGFSWQFNAPTNAAGYGNKRLYINSSNVVTLTLSGTIDARAVGLSLASSDTVGITINQNISPTARVQLAGSSGFTKTGNLYLRLQNTNDSLAGTVNVLHDATSFNQGSAGDVQVGAGGGASGATLAGVTRFNVSATGVATGAANSAGMRTRLRVLTGTNNANQINDSAVISLAGLGIFEYQGRTNFTETIGQLRLASSGVLDLDTYAQGATQGALTFTSGIDRANNRAQLIVMAQNTDGVMTSTVNLGSSHGLGTSLLPWATDSRARFMKVDGSNFLVTVAPTDVTDVSTITSSSTDYRITGTLSSSTFASGAQANSLGIYRGGASSYTLNVTDTLTIASGGLANANDGNNTATTIQGGTSLTSGSDALYISTGANTATGTLTISTPITGSIDVAVAGAGGVTFGGTSANTYSGTTYVNGGTLTLNKSTGINAVGSNVVVRNGGVLSASQNNQIPDGATVTIENGGFWNRGNSSETIGSLAGGGMVTANTNATAITTISNSVSPGDGGIGTMIVSSGLAAGLTNSLVMRTGAVFNFELSASGGTSDQMQFWNFSTNELVLNNNAINLSLTGTQTDGRYTVSLFKFYSDAGSNLTSSFITSGLTIGTTGTIIGTPTVNYNAGGSAIDLTYNVGAMFYTNGTTYTVTAAENYDAATYIRNGTIVNADVAGVLPTNTPTALVMDDTGSGSSVLNLGANQTVASLSGAGTSSIGLGVNTLTVNGTSPSSFAGTISGADGSLTKSGSGTLTLSGNNSYGGTTTISNGTISIGVLASAGYNSGIGTNATVTFAGVNATNTVLDYTGGNVTTDRTFVFNGTASSGEGGTIAMATSNTVITATGTASGTGKMILSEGTLVLSNTGTPNSFAPEAIQVDAGATLALGADNQIGDGTGLILNGGTFLTGTSSTGFSDTLGTLTLSASSTIDLGLNTTSRNLNFANSSGITWTAGTLTITNWTQAAPSETGAYGRLYFGSNTNGLTSGQLGQISFNIDGSLYGAKILSTGEVVADLVPIPEPRVYAAAIALLAAVGWRERRRILGLIARR